MNGNLLNAILAMDAYNRGYAAGIQLNDPDDTVGKILGRLIISAQSAITATSQEVKSGFYAVVYTLSQGQRIISFRGTDQPPQPDAAIAAHDLALLFEVPVLGPLNLSVKLANDVIKSITPDTWNGWFIGAGFEESAQALLAFEFYKDVIGGYDNLYSANVTLTGHSLGGGLAGLVGGAYGKTATMFDQMPFEAALQDTFNRSLHPQNDSDNALRQVVYGNGEINGPSYLSDRSFSIEGEALSSIRNNPLRAYAVASGLISLL